jgi:hypothetical protein
LTSERDYSLTLVNLSRKTNAMKHALFLSVILGVTTVTSPASAQFSSFPTSSDSCSNLCVKLDLGSANNESSFSSGFNNGFNSSTSTGANNLRWQVGVTWRPNPPEIIQVEGDKVKQRLDDNRSLMMALAEAISQNRTEMARGLAILLAPRLGYSDPRKLLAEMKEGATNINPAPKDRFPNPNSPPFESPKESTNPNPTPGEIPKGSSDVNPAPKDGFPNPNSPPFENPKGFTNPNPAPFETPKGSGDVNPAPIELR